MPLNSHFFFGSKTLVSLSRRSGRLGLTLVDIERTYGGGRNPLASRVPIPWGGSYSQHSANAVDSSVYTKMAEDVGDLATPSTTEGE